jgi:DNA modification methylase
MSVYENRSYLSAVEAAKFLGISVRELHALTKTKEIKGVLSPSGQLRYDLEDIKQYQMKQIIPTTINNIDLPRITEIKTDTTVQRFVLGNAMDMNELPNESVHLMITSPPYFNAKMYSSNIIENDLGNIHDMEQWFNEISKVWKEVYRVLQPGRKAFINIMNLPIKIEKTFKSLNLVGHTIDVMEQIGFSFKRDIVWHKTNGVRAHFGTYPYPGGILLNNMHEFILEFQKPDKPGFNKYGHLTKEQKEQSKIDKDFWLSLKNTDVWLIAPEASGDNRTHIAPFPYEIPRRLIKAYTYVTETILDPFAGSFITLQAARDLNRNGIGYEINKEIIFDAISRFRDQEKQTKLF